MVWGAWCRERVLLKCLDQKRWLLTPVFRFYGFTLSPTLLNELVFSQLWSGLDFGVVRGSLVVNTGKHSISINAKASF